MTEYLTGAHGLVERKATKRRIEDTLVSGRVWQGSVDDDDNVPREEGTGRVLPHIVIRYNAPVRSSRERNLTNGDLGQPHILSGTFHCVAGSAEDAQELMAALVETIVDWAPSAHSDPWRLSNGFGARRPATANTPTRFIEALFGETTVNLGVDSHA